MTSMDAETSVQVALRVRPQNSREQIDMCRMCTFCTSGEPQIVLGKDKAFTYDYVFDTDSNQDGIYKTCIETLVDGCFEGYNATVLAYGQTGSGKTYTMGSGFDVNILPEEHGMIPRAVGHIFNGIEARRVSALEKNEPPPQFEITAEFLELYNEELIDLFNPNREMGKKLRIHEDPAAGGNIYITGVTTHRVESEEETLGCLKRGALSRSVGSTNMNAQSSRSHAIFTLNISQQRPCKALSSEGGGGSEEAPRSSSEVSDWEMLRAKFHFVDLAGSERLKRTGATGERAKEGISINCGLLALGNVISALGDKLKRGSHVPYRDSKLTRLLQDSLGGNSRTLMIACVSPTDRDFMETLNTLKYANRARNIKNKVVVNQDKASQQLAMLRTRIQSLELELQEFRSGKRVVSEDGSVVFNDMANEITMLRTENDKLRLRVKAMQEVIDSQSERLAAFAADKEAAALGRQDESTGQVVSSGRGEDQLSTVIQGYMKQIEELKSRLLMSESLAHHNPGSPFRRAPSSVMARQRPESTSTAPFEQETEEILQAAKSDIQRLREKEEMKVFVADVSSSRHHRRHSARETHPHVHFNRTISLESEACREERPATVFESDEESNSSHEDEDSSEEEELTLHGTESSEDSDDDFDDTASLASSVAELSSEINLKQQLVDQLEKAQRNLYTMKQQYEDKMQLLQHQIKSTESERDKVLKDMTTRRGEGRQDDRVRDIKSRYEKQLQDMRSELKSLKSARKEHAKAMRKNAQHENELKRLKGDLLEMKKQRVKMLNQMRTEASQKKTEQARRAREVAQLRKESRKKEHKIKSLEADARRREAVLKRRQEELAALRRQTRSTQLMPSLAAVPSVSAPTSFAAVAALERDQRAMVLLPPAASAGGKEKLSRRKSSVFSSDSARRKWRMIERKIMDGIMKRQTMGTMARDMDRWIEQRDGLSRKMENLRRQKAVALQAKEVNAEELTSIEEDLDSITAHIDYVQQNITDLQNDLIALDDSKGDGETLEAHTIITSCNPREAKYLLEHLLDMVLNIGVKAEQKEAEVRSLEARLQASEQSAALIKTLSSPQVSLPLHVNTRTVTKGKTGPQQLKASPPLPPRLDLDADLTPPAGPSDSEHSDSSDNSQHEQRRPPRTQPNISSSKWRRRTALPSELAANSREKIVTDSSSSKQGNVTVEELTDGDVSANTSGGNGNGQSQSRRGSAEAKKRALKKRSVTAGELASGGPGVGGSPRPLRAEKSETSVWARLANTSHDSGSDTSKGSFQAEKSDSRKSGGRLLTCTHTACGHSGSILSICATQNLLFSASQDRTVKVWDLKSGSEMLTLDKHFSYVRSVRYCPRTRLIFTASQALIKIWDMRNYRAKCIKTFGPPSSSGPSSSDTVVQDLLVSPNGDTLFSAAGNFVHFWDLRKFMHSGRLVGHNGAVCALTIRGGLMATGSRDRFIKLYDLDSINMDDSSGSISQAPVCTLYPPHYDAVSSFAVQSDLLFSACGVTFKQWDIKEHSLKHAVDGAHSQGNTINSLAVLPFPIMPLLVSGCKGGILKLWNPETCGNIGEVTAHKNSINAITTNDNCIFTGSSDKTIKIWRPSPFQDWPVV